METADQAPTIFARELEGLLAIAAQNIRVTFMPSGLVRRVDLCSIMEHHREGKTLTVTVGDLVSEDTRSLLVTLRTDPGKTEGWAALGTVSVTYDHVALGVTRLAARGSQLEHSTVTYDDVVGGICSKILTHELLVGAIAPVRVAAIPPDAAVGKELLILRAAKVLQAAIAQADAGDVKEAIQRLTAFLATPEVAAATDPEIQAGRRRLKEMLHDLQDRGFDKMSRKHMFYSSRAWTRRGAGSAI